MICVIPARKGSTRIPLKNIKEFKGKPIIEYSIETARKSKLFDKIYISTDIEYLLSKDYGPDVIAVKRDSEYCKDDVGTQEVVKKAVGQIGMEEDCIICCIYPCSPLLLPKDLIKAEDLLIDNRKMDYAFSVGNSPLRDAGNFYMGYKLSFISDVPIHAEHSIMVPLPEERVIDINTMDDWAEAERKYEALYGN